MELYRRKPNGPWYFTVYVGRKRYQESTGTRIGKEAERIARRRISQIEDGVKKPVKMKFAELGEEYVKLVKKRSLERDKQILVHLNEAFGTMHLADIKKPAIEAYRTERLKVVTPATVNREVAQLKHMYNLASDWDYFSGTNPVKGITMLKESNLKLRVLSHEEEVLLLANSFPYLRDIIVFAINTGLRIGDILSLQWSDVEDNVVRKMMQKTERLVQIPLNEHAMGVIEGQRGISTYIIRSLPNLARLSTDSG